MMKKNLGIQLSAIAAMGDHRVIGYQNKLPWHLPADLKHFKEITFGHPILMGRKTYESIGRPLPGRTNLVLTRQISLEIPGIIPVASLEEALTKAEQSGAKELFIIGGADVYHQCLPVIDQIYLTHIHHTFEGDAFFPELPAEIWEETSREDHVADAQNPYDYSFLLIRRRLAI